MATEIERLARDRSRWRRVLLVAMLVMAICLALLATVWRGDVGMPGRLTMGMLFLSTSVACYAWWRHFAALLVLKRVQQGGGSY